MAGGREVMGMDINDPNLAWALIALWVGGALFAVLSSSATRD